MFQHLSNIPFSYRCKLSLASGTPSRGQFCNQAIWVQGALSNYFPPCLCISSGGRHPPHGQLDNKNIIMLQVLSSSWTNVSYHLTGFIFHQHKPLQGAELRTACSSKSHRWSPSSRTGNQGWANCMGLASTGCHLAELLCVAAMPLSCLSLGNSVP